MFLASSGGQRVICSTLFHTALLTLTELEKTKTDTSCLRKYRITLIGLNTPLRLPGV